MHRLIIWSTLAASVALASGCGNKGAHPESPESKELATGEHAEGAPGEESEAAGPDGGAEDPCVGFDIANLPDVLLESACEEPNVDPESVKSVDLKGKLEVTVSPSPPSVSRGGKADLVVTFANKTKAPLTLHFRIDPTPRFEVETYDKKGKLADRPRGEPPPPPKGVNPPEPTPPKSARVTIAANGTARATIPWQAVRTKWAPEKVRGTPPEMGYPRKPAGPLRRGKYTVKVLTPLVGVFEGIDKEMSAPRVEIEIGK